MDAIKPLIIDEADEMLNMGFIEDVEKIIAHTNPAKRTLFFSVTVLQIKDNFATKKRNISENLTAILDESIDKKYYTWADNIARGMDPTDLLAATLYYCFDEELNPDVYGEIQAVGKQNRLGDKHGKARLFVALGKRGKMTPLTINDRKSIYKN